jgi:replicative DNA helicase
MQDDTFVTNSTGTKATFRERFALTTKEAPTATGATPTAPKSSTDISKAIKNGELTPEQAVTNAFPSPFQQIKDISVELLRIEPLQSGLRVLDQNLVLKKGRPELVVVGAGTSHGKSAFMVQLAASVSKLHHVFVYSLEMDERDIKARLLAPRIHQPLEKIMAGQVPKEKLKEADQAFEEMKLHVCTNGRREISFVQSSAYDMAQKVGAPALIVVDYLQLMRGPTKATRTNEIAEILGGLKELAKTMKCPVLIGSQLNRNCEHRGKRTQLERGVADYTPIKSDLMDSGSIEHDADVILFLSRPYVYDQETRPNEADMIIAKNRNGKTCKAILNFSGSLCSFSEASGSRGI